MDECGFITDERHSNTRGVVHGAMISPAFDLALGNASWAAAGECACATVQLNVHFVSGMNLGEFAIIRSEIIHATRSLVFARGVMRVDERTIAAADGVWKILSDRAA
jgi:acyl-coenzyme A thioesterase PaaI-like protein